MGHVPSQFKTRFQFDCRAHSGPLATALTASQITVNKVFMVDGSTPIIGISPALLQAWARFEWMSCSGVTKRGGRGLLATVNNSFPPASEREARMDDPTRRCENDTGNETRLSGPPIPSGGPFFLSLTLYLYLRASYLWHLYVPLN